MIKHPLVPGAVCYAAGLLAGDRIPLSLWIVFAIAFLLLGAAFTLPRLRPCLIYWLIGFTGWTNLAVRDAALSPFDLRQIQGDVPQLLSVRGTVVNRPDERPGAERERVRARLELHSLKRKESDWEPAAGQILLNIQGGPSETWYTGQTLEAFGVLTPPPKAFAPGLFDYRNFLKRSGVHYLLNVDAPGDVQILSSPALPPWSDRCIAWGRKVMAAGLPEEDQTLRLLWAMTLGWNQAFSPEVYRPFTTSGTMHVFAISGLHIALIAGILIKLLRAFRLSRATASLIVLPVIWFYTAATGWQPSAIRSTIMMSVILGGWVLKRPGNLANSLAVAALLILLWDPRQLFGASFQLSFFVVLSLALLMPPLERARDWLLAPDPLLPAQLVSQARQRLNTVLRPALTLLASAVAAWIGSLPLTTYYFHLVSPVALMANLVVVPASGLALAANLGSLLCGLCQISGAVALFNHSAWFWMRIMEGFSVWCAALPGAYFYIPSPTPLDVALYYCVLLLVVTQGRQLAARRVLHILLMVGVGGYVFVRGYQYLGRSEVAVLPLGNGMAVFEQSPWTGAVLFDTGDAANARFRTEPFLRSRGVNTLDALILTHADAAHVGGATAIHDAFRPGTLAVSPVRARSPVYRKVLAAVREQAEVREVATGDFVCDWSVLHPESGTAPSRADDAALVFFRDYQDFSILLLSDLGHNGQQSLLAKHPGVRADILICGLASDRPGLQADLVAALSPRLIIVCDSEWPATARAPAAYREGLNRGGVRSIYTSEEGPVFIKRARGGCEIHTDAVVRFLPSRSARN